jgi:ABC-type branched-subunit amino acid transport system substrate-binding protein
MKVLADGIKRAGSTEGPKLRNAIAQTQKFPGVTGTISLDAQRNAVKPAVVLKLQDRKYIYQETIYPEGMNPPQAAAPAPPAGSAAAVASPAKN